MNDRVMYHILKLIAFHSKGSMHASTLKVILSLENSRIEKDPKMMNNDCK